MDNLKALRIMLNSREMRLSKVADSFMNTVFTRELKEEIDFLKKKIAKLETPDNADQINKARKVLFEIFYSDYKRLQTLFNEDANTGIKNLDDKWKGLNGLFTKNKYYEKNHSADYIENNIIEQSIIDADKLLKTLNSKLDKYGPVVDVIELDTNIAGIEGVVKCADATVRIKSTLCGGYNIQRLHIRLTVKAI